MMFLRQSSTFQLHHFDQIVAVYRRQVSTEGIFLWGGVVALRA